MNSIYTLCRKSLMAQLGARWCGYDVRMKFHLGNFANHSKLFTFHTKKNNIDVNVPVPNEEDEYDRISMDIGSWIYYKVSTSGYNTMLWEDDFVHHFLAVSWGERRVDGVFGNIPACVLDLERHMKQYHPKYFELYAKYVTPRT